MLYSIDLSLGFRELPPWETKMFELALFDDGGFSEDIKSYKYGTVFYNT